MKKFTKATLITFMFLLHISFVVDGQTNVSGGIYSNTTWTLANSPYIVVDTVVVFPGVTLTIEPGVVVKFENNIRLEIRQATLIAEGTSNDSITFTSNSLAPSAGIWDAICFNGKDDLYHSKIKYCNFFYASYAIYFTDNYTIVYDDSLTVVNSTFSNNINGIYLFQGFTYISTCNFRNNTSGIHATLIHANNCNIFNNQEGIGVGSSIVINCIIDSNVVGLNAFYYNIIENCEIKYNDIGLRKPDEILSNFSITENIIENNNIGVQLSAPEDSLFCNKICNNLIYNLKYMATYGSNFNLPNNYWCTTDSSNIAAKIYDGYDNINLSLVSFMPLDTLQCYLETQIPINETQNFSFNIFPNPANDYITVALPTDISKTEIKIFNILGSLEYSSIITSKKSIIDISTFADGIHIIQIVSGKNNSRQKFIKQ